MIFSVLNVHTAFGAGDDHGSLGFAVHQDGEVIFFLNIHALGDEDLVHQLAFFAGLVGHKDLPQHGFGEFSGLVRGITEMHPALEAIFEDPFAASAGMNLGFDDDCFARQRRGRGLGLLRRARDGAARGRDVVFLEKFLGLILVNVHAGGKWAGFGQKESESAPGGAVFGRDPAGYGVARIFFSSTTL